MRESDVVAFKDVTWGCSSEMIRDDWEIVRLKFEQACSILAVSHSAEAEKFIFSVREHIEGLNLCKYILEKSSDELVLFHTFMAIESLMSANWSCIVDDQSLPNVAEFLFQYVFCNCEKISFWLARQISSTIARILKHAWLYPSSTSTLSNQTLRGNTMNFIQELVQKTYVLLFLLEFFCDLRFSENIPFQVFSLHLIQSFIEEFKRKNTVFNESYQYNLECFKFFENNELVNYFEIIFSLLKFYVSKFEYYSTLPQSAEIIKELISTINMIFSWPFGQGQLILGLYNLKDSWDLCPPLTWKHKFSSDQQILCLFKDLYVKLRSTELAGILRECWIQLASFYLPTSSSFSPSDRKQFMSYWCTEFISNYLHMCQYNSFDLMELRDLAYIVKKFFNICTVICGLFEIVESDLLVRLLEVIFKLTVETFKAMTLIHQDETLNEQLDFLEEAVETWIEVWSMLVNQHSRLVQNALASRYASQVFRVYVSTRFWISKADVFGKFCFCNDKNLIIHSALQTQLQNLGAIGRCLCLPTLEYLMCNTLMIFRSLIYNICNSSEHSNCTILLDQDLVYLDTAYEALKTLKVSNRIEWLSSFVDPSLIEYLSSPANFSNSPVVLNSLQACFEKSHLLILIVTHFLCSIDELEYSVVPSQISNASCFLEETLSPDWILYLLQTLFLLSSLEERHLFNWNVLVSETWTWFAIQFSNSYLLKSSSSIPILSTSLIEHFGFNSQSAASTLNYMFSKILFNFIHWPQQTRLLQLNCILLQRIAYMDKLNVELVEKLPAWHELYKFCIGQQMLSTVPLKIQSSLLHSLSCFSGSELCLQLLLHPFVDKFAAFLNSQFISDDHSKAILVQSIYQLCGLASVTKFTSAKIIGTRLLTIIEQLPKLLCAFSDEHLIIKAILIFLKEFFENILPLFVKDQLNALKNFTANLYRLLLEFRSRRYQVKCESKSVEQMHYREILLWLQTVSSLSQLSEFNEETLMGFQAIECLFDDNLARYPKLSSAYFQVVLNLLSEQDVLLQIDCYCFERIFNNIQSALRLDDQNVELMALEMAASAVSNNLRAMKNHQSHFGLDKIAVLANFMKFMLMWVFLGTSFSIEFVEVVSTVLFALICTNFDTYCAIVRDLTEGPQEYKQELLKYFNLLSSDLNFEWGKKNKEVFKTNLKNVLSPIRNIFNKNLGHV